jgi:hypothetical protein
MSTEEKAIRVIEKLLDERVVTENEEISVVGLVNELNDNGIGSFADIEGQEDLLQKILKGGVLSSGNYIYYPGYDGATGNQDTGIAIHSNVPLEPFDDFYGNPDKYPVIAKISKALEAAGYDNLDGFGAGKLVAKN